MLFFFSTLSRAQKTESIFIPSPLVIKNKTLEESATLQYKTSLKKNKPDLSSRKTKTLKVEYKKRKEYFLEMLHDGDLIVSGELYDYTQSILDKITNSVNIPAKKLFIVRDNTPNAFNMGDDNIFIHLGLIYLSNNEDELAYTIAHELGHNELSHYDDSVLDYVDLEHNDSIKKRMKKILKSDYGKVSALNKLMIPWLLASSSNSRRHEYAADAYALESIIEIGYDLTNAIEIYDMFENHGEQKDTIPFDFEHVFNLDLSESDFSEALSAKKESSLGTFKKQKKALEDQLRSHPFNDERRDVMFDKMTEENASKMNKNGIGLDFPYFKDLAHNEIIADAIHSLNLNDAIFYSILLYKKDENSLFAHKMITTSFALLGHEKIKRRAGKRVPSHSPYFDNNYNQLLHFLREISPQQCFDIVNNWNRNNQDIITNKVSNPSLLIMDLLNENYSKYKIRYQLEKENNNYYLKPLLNLINTEYKNK